MEFAKNLQDSLRGRPSAPAPGVPSNWIDWSELHARLGAAHAAARELAGLAQSGNPVPGRFAQWQSGVGAKSQSSTPVNRTDLADGKAAWSMDSAIAGETMIGGRGQ